MRNSFKLILAVSMSLMLAQPALGTDSSSHQKSGVDKHGAGGKKAGGRHHGYGRPKGPPADIPAHIKSRTSEDGSGVNLNNSLVGVEGISIMANTPELKNVVSLALKRNKLGDDGVKILAESETFKQVEK